MTGVHSLAGSRSFIVVRLRSLDDVPFLSDRKLQLFDQKQRREIARCEANFLPFMRLFGSKSGHCQLCFQQPLIVNSLFLSFLFDPDPDPDPDYIPSPPLPEAEIGRYLLTAVGSRQLRQEKEMPSIQSALPPELADNVIRLYRECLRRAYYVGHQVPSPPPPSLERNIHGPPQFMSPKFSPLKLETIPKPSQPLSAPSLATLLGSQTAALTGQLAVHQFPPTPFTVVQLEKLPHDCPTLSKVKTVTSCMDG
ncbi:hypothetical protein MA16_Dca018139 [Dendrobium catenatum]|uniref:Uncharacterized protein n=1 Tax=Dendrobium catenatum TaxID=906689 RepID=A0A2I0WHC9_9ASPA|nr:hypothetical protein MA16_Dca018139 [Dendrobium catenatum]